jgi:hypothetical protein
MGGYMGVFEGQNPVASLGDLLLNIQICFGGIIFFKTTVGDVYTQFAPVYYNETVDAQTVTVSTNSAARSIKVGYVVPGNSSLVAGAAGTSWNITGASGVYVQVWIAPYFPLAVATLV